MQIILTALKKLKCLINLFLKTEKMIMSDTVTRVSLIFDKWNCVTDITVFSVELKLKTLTLSSGGDYLELYVASYIYIVKANLWRNKCCLCGFQPLDLLSPVVTSLPSYCCHCSCALHSLLQVLLLFHSHLSLDINFTSLLIRSFSRVGMKIKGHSPFFH